MVFLRRDYLKNHRNATVSGDAPAGYVLVSTLLEVDKAAREREEIIHEAVGRKRSIAG